MEVLLNKDGGTLVASISGRINTATAPQFEKELIPALDGVEELILDMTDLLYISSAGLRVILTAQKVMARQGNMVLRNLKPEVYEVFEMTGFVDFLTIE
ncbi:MAG: STAS domain-containing protein [Atopobiaceae bacterium]|nr:STAS domain-containing protein [Atopobiaceae bacterium]MBR3314815.1 STAS domain-containing protein [Atopobiaceae bacterium]